MADDDEEVEVESEIAFEFFIPKAILINVRNTTLRIITNKTLEFWI